MHFKPILAWTVSDVAGFALITTFFIGLLLWIVAVVRHRAKLRAEENKQRIEKAIRIVRETAPELACRSAARERLHHDGDEKGQDQISSDRRGKAQSSISLLTP